MRALRRCDFCDAEAVGTFEVVPAELEPTEAEQRRVVLCDDCSRRLETLLEPLFDRLAAADETADDAEPGTVVATDDEPTAAGDRSSNPNATVSATDGTRDEGERSTGADASAAGDGATDGRNAAESTGTTTATGDSDDERDATDEATDGTDAGSIGGITVEHDAGVEIDRDAASDETETDVESAAEVGESADGPTDDASESDEAIDDASDDEAAADTGTDGDEPAETATADRDGGASEATAAAHARAPKAYAKIVRLLRNRQFPMERDAVESLAARAYDLETQEVEAIVDRAIENGEFEEDGRLLRRP